MRYLTGFSGGCLSRGSGLARPRLGSVRQKLVDGFASFGLELVTVGSFLTPDAELRPRDGIQSLGFDFLFTVQAGPRRRAVPQQGIPVCVGSQEAAGCVRQAPPQCQIRGAR